MRITNEELLQIIKEELEAVIDEKKGKKRKAAKKKRRKRKKRKKAKGKKDACYHKVKARYSVWPSAYASGALVKCRSVGAANWGNSKKEGLNESKDEFKAHMMYDPKSDKSEMANKMQDHERLAKKGYTHVDPKEIRKIIGVGQGGAAGMDPFLEKFGKEMEDEIVKTLEAMPDIGQHENGDYVMKDGKQVDIVKEVKNCGCGQDPCKTYGRQ